MLYINMRINQTDHFAMSDLPEFLSDIVEHNVMVDCQALHAELLDHTTGTV